VNPNLAASIYLVRDRFDHDAHRVLTDMDGLHERVRREWQACVEWMDNRLGWPPGR
jgi:hypothetical protein